MIEHEQTTLAERCTCYVRGAHGERPRKRVLPGKRSMLGGRWLPYCETDDPRCPIHGIAGAKLKRALRI